MTRDPDRTHTLVPIASDDPALDAGLAAAFGPATAGWSAPPLLRDDSSDGPLVQPASTEMPRTASDRYQLLGEVARGGMGVILKGRDPRLGRDMAFKVLKTEHVGKPAAEQRFVEEAQVGGQLQHPGILPVYDLGRFDDGRPFFAMKFVKGDTLADQLAERPDPGANRGKFLQIFLKVCETVAYAHSRGVIHRDIKPANIMVANYGEVLVMDWGLAKVLPRGGVADEAKATQMRRDQEPPRDEPTVIHTARVGSIGSETLAGSVMGTPAFMPPEQAGGEVDKLDERADVFGLGAVLCVILTDRPPFVADSADATRLMAIRGELDDAFARLGSCGADADLVALSKRCLSAKREDRPRHAGEVAEAVTRYLAEVEARAHRAEIERAAAVARTTEERKRRKVQLALAATVLGLVVLIAGGAWSVNHLRRSREAEIAQRRVDTDRAVTAALAEVSAILDQTRSLSDDAPQWSAALATAKSSARRAESLLAAGEPTDELTERVRQMRDRLAQAERDREFVARLEVIRMQFGEQFDPAETARKYVSAFREHGLDRHSLTSAEMARRIREHPHAEPLAAAAAALLNHTQDPIDRAYWDNVLTNVFPADSFYGRWRTADRSGNTREMVRLADQADPASLTPTTIWLMSLNLTFRQPSEAQSAARLLRAGLSRYPSDFWLNYELCTVALRRLNPPRLEEAIRHGTAAVALRPQIARAHHEVAFALFSFGDLKLAERESREAIRLDPTFVWSHFDLALVLRNKGNLDSALEAAKQAALVEPKNPLAHIGVGWILGAKDEWQGAMAVAREVLRIAPADVRAHVLLGEALRATGDLDGAVAEFQEAVRLAPNHAEARSKLNQTERLRSAIPRLEAVRRGEKVTDIADEIQLAQLAAEPWNRDYSLAVRLFSEALERVNPPDPLILSRYNAACAAVRLAAGDDKGGPVGAAERQALHEKARNWLLAELAPHRRLAWAGTPATRKKLADRYAYWQQDRDLASVRDPQRRAILPPNDRTAWETFWTEVEIVRKQALTTLSDSRPGG
jgi:serine/threonine-protein kinase